MFVTMPHFEQFMPSNLVGPNQKYWRAVTLSLESPWYLFVYEAECGRQKVPQTTLVAWESTLLDILATVPEADRRAIARLEKEPGQTAHWKVSWIQSIWAPSSDEAEETGLVLLELEGDSQLRNAHLQPVPTKGGRELLFTAPSPSSLRRAPPPTVEVPEDFPQAPPDGAVPGAHPKLGVSKERVTYTDGSSVTRAERYDICLDLVNQLVSYVERKLTAKPELNVNKLVAQVRDQVEEKRFGWGLSPSEGEWVKVQVKARLEPMA